MKLLGGDDPSSAAAVAAAAQCAAFFQLPMDDLDIEDVVERVKACAAA